MTVRFLRFRSKTDRKAKYPCDMFNGPPLLFACHTKPDCSWSTINSGFVGKDSACTGHGDVNSAVQQTSTPLSFSPVLDIFPTYRILVRNPHQRNFPEAFFRRHLKMGRESIDNLLTLLRGYVQ